MKRFVSMTVFMIVLLSTKGKAQYGYQQYPYYQQPVQYQLPAPQTMNQNYQLSAPQYQQPMQNGMINRTGQWVQQNGARFVQNAVGGYFIDRTLGQQVRNYYEQRGAYCPPKPMIVPGWVSPAWYYGTCAYPAQ
ncbi:MAG: hypothetical protein JNM14_03425 [Ferruginibacter sp.]|nr:hypothetical protein [Ferruginibacter sp.]